MVSARANQVFDAGAERLPSRYRRFAYGGLAVVVSLFIAMMWYLVSNGLTKLW